MSARSLVVSNKNIAAENKLSELRRPAAAAAVAPAAGEAPAAARSLAKCPQWGGARGCAAVQRSSRTRSDAARQRTPRWHQRA